MTAATATVDARITSITGRQWLTLVMVQLSTLLFGMTITMANVVLPQVKGALSATQEEIAWVVTGFLVATAVGPYHEFTPTFGTGHPSGVNLALALDMGKYVNSFRWRDGILG